MPKQNILDFLSVLNENPTLKSEILTIKAMVPQLTQVQNDLALFEQPNNRTYFTHEQLELQNKAFTQVKENLIKQKVENDVFIIRRMLRLAQKELQDEKEAIQKKLEVLIPTEDSPKVGKIDSHPGTISVPDGDGDANSGTNKTQSKEPNTKKLTRLKSTVVEEDKKAQEADEQRIASIQARLTSLQADLSTVKSNFKKENNDVPFQPSKFFLAKEFYSNFRTYVDDPILRSYTHTPNDQELTPSDPAMSHGPSHNPDQDVLPIHPLDGYFTKHVNAKFDGCTVLFNSNVRTANVFKEMFQGLTLSSRLLEMNFEPDPPHSCMVFMTCEVEIKINSEEPLYILEIFELVSPTYDQELEEFQKQSEKDQSSKQGKPIDTGETLDDTNNDDDDDEGDNHLNLLHKGNKGLGFKKQDADPDPELVALETPLVEDNNIKKIFVPSQVIDPNTTHELICNRYHMIHCGPRPLYCWPIDGSIREQIEFNELQVHLKQEAELAKIRRAEDELRAAEGAVLERERIRKESEEKEKQRKLEKKLKKQAKKEQLEKAKLEGKDDLVEEITKKAAEAQELKEKLNLKVKDSTKAQALTAFAEKRKEKLKGKKK